jgi:predicted ATPase
LPDLDAIKTISRPEDKTRYLMLGYKNGVEAPSWVLSDGTLRLLALTILAYRSHFKGVYLIEEPENGVHPTALQTIYQSLSSVYDGQVLVTSHSPILLNLSKPEELLCFQKTSEGTEIIRGDRHPLLQDWKGDVSLSDLFAAGVLG